MDVTLTRDSWHFKLQLFVFDDVPFQKNFCPYFWITIFCLFSFPFVAFWVFIKKPIISSVEWLGNGYLKLMDMVDEKICEPYKERSLDSITPEQAFILYEAWDALNLYGGGKQLSNLSAKFWQWRMYFSKKKDNEDAWQKYAEEGRKKVMEWRERDRLLKIERDKADVLRKERIKKMHLWIIKVTKVIFFGLGSLVALAIAYFAFKGLGVMWAKRAGIWHFFVTYGPLILGVTIGIIGFALLLFLIVKGVKCIVNLTPPKVEKVEKENRTLSAIKGFFSFFWIFIVNFKKNHCPHIEWVD